MPHIKGVGISCHDHLEKSSKYHLILIFGHSLKHRHIHIFPIVFLLLFVGELEISETENASVSN